MIDALRADGIRVEAPILPGHEPVGPIMPASSWRDWATASEAVEWLAFHFGGQAGKSLSLTIRRVGAVVTAWLATLAKDKGQDRPA